MDEATYVYLRDIFQRRHEAIVDAWYGVVVRTSFASRSGSEVWRYLSALTNRVTTILLTEPFNHSAAYAVGTDLTQLHYLQPEVLKGTHEVLGHELTVGLSNEQLAGVYPRIMMLLGNISTGFFRQARNTLLAEQEQIRGALFTERLRIEAALRESEERLRTVINNLPVVLFTIDRAGIFTMMEGRVLEELGVTPGRLVGRSILTTLREYPQLLNNIYRAMNGDSFTTQVEAAQRVFETRYAPMRDQQGNIQGVIGLALDVTKHTQAEADLAETRRLLAARLDTERGNAVHYLYDNVIYRLLGPSYELREIERQIAQEAYYEEQSQDAVVSAQWSLWGNITSVVTQLRQIIQDLCPARLDDLNLVTAIDCYVDFLRDGRGATMPSIVLDLDQRGANVSQSKALCLFRAAREALRNALSHAQAHNVSVALHLDANDLVLSVRDDGHGFRVPPSWHDLEHTSYSSLVRIAEQVDILGGRFTVTSEPGAGTAVVVRLPVQHNLDDGDAVQSRTAGS